MFKKIQLIKELTTKKDTEQNENPVPDSQSQIFDKKQNKWVTPEDSSSSQSGTDTPLHDTGGSM